MFVTCRFQWETESTDDFVGPPSEYGTDVGGLGSSTAICPSGSSGTPSLSIVPGLYRPSVAGSAASDGSLLQFRRSTAATAVADSIFRQDVNAGDHHDIRNPVNDTL